MPNFNRVILAGHLTRDPDIQYTPSNIPVAKFGLAVSRKRKDRDDEVLFVDVVAWQKSAETINQYCHKGDPLMIEGRLQLEQWTGQDGTKRSKHTVVVDTFQLLYRAPSWPTAPPAEPASPPPSDDFDMF